MKTSLRHEKCLMIKFIFLKIFGWKIKGENNLTKKWIIEFCNAILDRKINFSWQLPSGTRSEAVDFEAAQLLYKSGCRNFGYAPESGSPEILTTIKKKVKIDSLIQSLKSFGLFSLFHSGQS